MIRKKQSRECNPKKVKGFTDLTNLKEIIKKYKTPFYLYDTAALHERTEMMRQKLPDIGLCFAMKAAPILAGSIYEMVDRLEVCSPGEYEICIRNAVPPEKLLVSGVNKTYDSIRRILELGNGRGWYTIESPEHYEILEKCAADAGVKLRCFIRLSSGNQFGVDKATLEMLAEKVMKSESLELTGIHFFSGTQKTLKRIEAELTELSEYGPELMKKLAPQDELELEFGPGLGVDYFFDPRKAASSGHVEAETASSGQADGDVASSGQVDGKATSSGQGTQQADSGLTGRSVERQEAERALGSLAELIEKTGIRKLFKRITFEHGRFIAASTGRYFTGIADLKTTYDVNYAILEGGIHQLTYYGSMAGMKVPYITVISPGGEAKGSSMDAGQVKNSAGNNTVNVKEYVLAGSLCSINDIIVRKAALPELSMGDTLMFDLAGAYSLTEGIGLFLSRDLPAILMKDEKGNVRLLRDHMETNPINDGSTIR